MNLTGHPATTVADIAIDVTVVAVVLDIARRTDELSAAAPPAEIRDIPTLAP